MRSRPCFDAVGPRKDRYRLRGHACEDGRFVPELDTRLYTYEEAQRYTPVGFCPQCLGAFAPGTAPTCRTCGLVVQVESDVPPPPATLDRALELRRSERVGISRPVPDPGPVTFTHEPFTVIPAPKDMLGKVLAIQKARNPHAN